MNTQDPKHWLDATKQQLAQQTSAATISANYAAILLQFLASRGIATAPLLAAAGISRETLDTASAQIPYPAYAKLARAALAEQPDQPLALEFGRRLNISTHGLLGYAVMSSPSLAKAAELVSKYIKIRNQLIKIDFQQPDDGHAAIVFDVEQADPALYRFEIETSMSSLYGVWVDLLGNSDGMQAMHFAFAPPAYADTFPEYFSIPVLFNQADNRLCFTPAAFLRLARMTDPTLTRIAEQQCQQLLDNLQGTQQAEVSLKVKQLLLKSPGHFLSRQAVAEQLHITPRTLNRHLTRENTSFQAILDGIRREIAVQCLQTTDWNIDEIAYMLNYSDSSNFTRAFKRWLGVSPKQFRQDL